MTEKRTLDAEIQFVEHTAANVADLAETIFDRSLAFCAHKMRLPANEEAADLLRQGDPIACQYWHYALAGQVAEYLGAWDQDVKAIYSCDYDATPQDLSCRPSSPASLIHMLVWTQRKTAALEALVDTLDHALTTLCADALDVPRLSRLLDVQFVNDADVENRTGYGALLTSLYNRPILVWER